MTVLRRAVPGLAGGCRALLAGLLLAPGAALAQAAAADTGTGTVLAPMQVTT